MKDYLLETSGIYKNFGDMSRKNSDFQSEKRRLTLIFHFKTVHYMAFDGSGILKEKKEASATVG